VLLLVASEFRVEDRGPRGTVVILSLPQGK
jgi:hypothetical protein